MNSAAGSFRLGCILFLVCAGIGLSQSAWSQDGTIEDATFPDATTQPTTIQDASFPDAALPAKLSPAAEPSSLAGTIVPAETFVSPNPGAASDSAQVRVVTQEKPKELAGPVESELIVEGLYSYGNYKIFASGFDMKLFTAGVEYDRHSWGYFLRARLDYVAEFLPLVLLDKPVNVDIWGYPIPNPKGKYNREYVPGIGFSPIGFRMLWRDKKAIKPYLEAKGGVLLFAQKAPSSESSYVNFSLQSATGVQVKVNERWGLRLGLFSDFHFSDAFVVPVNPGLDVMNANLGIVYQFTPRSR